MKKLLLSGAIALTMTVMVGCSNTQEKYYAAVEKAAVANAEMHKAKMEALTAMANSGDPAAQGAAVMAMALTTAPTVTPAYIESESLSWARVLATPVATVAGLAIQADVAKNASDNAAQVQMRSFQSNETIQLGQQDMLVNALGASASGSAAAVSGVVDLGVAGFDALNKAGDQTVTVSQTGLSTAEQIATVGLNTTENVSLGAQTSLVTLGTVGIDATSTVGTTGIDAVGAVGVAGIGAVVDVSTTSQQTILQMSQDHNALLSDYNQTIENIATQNPTICSTDANGVTTCQ